MSRLADMPADVVYPSGDGKPMAETWVHVKAILWLLQALEDALAADHPDAHLGGNMFWYWQEGDPKKRLAPDLMVVPGAGRHDRRSFKSWEEGGRVPAVVIEVSSEKTAKYDQGPKRQQYRRLGVGEYFLFDPDGVYLPAPLLGYRLAGRRYVPLAAEDGRLTSQLGFGLAAEGQMLRLFDGRTGRPIPTRAEAVEAAQATAAEAVRQAAEAVRQATEAARSADEAERLRTDEMARQAAEIARLTALLGERTS